MANERLRNAISASRISIGDIADHVGVDLKTVQRWLNGRLPHPKHRWKLAEMLEVEEHYLWPESSPPPISPKSEIVTAYARRSETPGNAWWQLFNQAQERIDLLANAMLFLLANNTQLADLLREKVINGCTIRIMLADPKCEAIRLRDEEEGLGGTLPERIRTSLHYFGVFKGISNIIIHYHSTILYNSLFRADNEMFVTPHLYGLHGSKAPLLHIRRLGTGGIFDTFQQHFEDVWATSKPVE